MSQAQIWEPVRGLAVPCADISLNWTSGTNAQLVVQMHFSRVRGGYDSDLELSFKDAMYFAWEDESLNVMPIPKDLPLCKDPAFSDWVYPTLVLSDSPMASGYADKAFEKDDPQHANVGHFLLVSMNDVLQVISVGVPDVEVR
ncbi:MAG: hypothetical protein AB8C46_14880 [Burkholderiaceae bacterium]